LQKYIIKNIFLHSFHAIVTSLTGLLSTQDVL